MLQLPEVPPRVGDPRGHHPAGRGAAVATGWHCGAVPECGGDGWLCPAATSPTLHPVQSPQNRFCILTVAPDTLPAIATMLIDVLFYSHRWVTRVGTSVVVPQLGVTPLHLAPCRFSSSGCILQSVFCSLEHATRGCCMSCCHSWELEPPSPGATVLRDKPHISAKQRGAVQRWLRCARAVHGNILGTAFPCGTVPSRVTTVLCRFPQTRSFCVPLTVGHKPVPGSSRSSLSPPKEPSAGGQDLDSITFFAFSLIEGYISIVMDAETQKR